MGRNRPIRLTAVKMQHLAILEIRFGKRLGMKIVLQQKSGLGNQLFQYAAGLYFARRYSAQLEIIREPEERAVSFGHPRPFLLSKFRIAAPVRSSS